MQAVTAPPPDFSLPQTAIPSPNKFFPPPWLASAPHENYCFREISLRPRKTLGYIDFLRNVPFVIFGRDLAASHIFVGHPSVSGQHAVALWSNDDQLCHIIDLESASGTFLNGELINHSERIELRPGAEVVFGKSAHAFIFEQKGTVVATPPKPDTPLPAGGLPPPSQPPPQPRGLRPSRDIPPLDRSPRGLPPLDRAPQDYDRRPLPSGPPPPDFDRRGPLPPDFDRRGPLPPDFDRRGPPPPDFDRRGPPPPDFDLRGPPPPDFDPRGPPPPDFDPRGPPPPDFDPRGPPPPDLDRRSIPPPDYDNDRRHGPPDHDFDRRHGPPQQDHDFDPRRPLSPPRRHFDDRGEFGGSSSGGGPPPRGPPLRRYDDRRASPGVSPRFGGRGDSFERGRGGGDYIRDDRYEGRRGRGGRGPGGY